MMDEMLRLDGKVIVITGAGRGLGRAYALLFSQRGAAVVVNDLGVETAGGGNSAAPAGAVVDEIRFEGGTAIADTSDIATAGGAQTLADLALDRFGKVDGLINNAGIFPPMRPFLETPFEDFEQAWRVHCGGTLLLCRALLPHFLERDTGSIVNTCSIQGLFGGPTSAPYSAAKGAVQALTLSLAAAVRGTNVRVNAISPGGYTRMLEGIGEGTAFADDLKAYLDPALVSPLIVWLCHDRCSEHGGIFQAFAGRIGRTVIGELEGIWDFAPTPESIARILPGLPETGPLIRARDSTDLARALLAEAAERRAALR